MSSLWGKDWRLIMKYEYLYSDVPNYDVPRVMNELLYCHGSYGYKLVNTCMIKDVYGNDILRIFWEKGTEEYDK